MLRGGEYDAVGADGRSGEDRCRLAAGSGLEENFAGLFVNQSELVFDQSFRRRGPRHAEHRSPPYAHTLFFDHPIAGAHFQAACQPADLFHRDTGRSPGRLAWHGRAPHPERGKSWPYHSQLRHIDSWFGMIGHPGFIGRVHLVLLDADTQAG